MAVVNMRAARSQLSRLVARIESGAESEIVIARHGKPVARLLPCASPAKQGPRPLGLAIGQYATCSQEAFDRDNDEIAALFLSSEPNALGES